MVFLQFIAFFMLMQITPVLAQSIRPDPEIATGVQNVHEARAREFMMVTANPLATKAGYEILKRGGSAADAAIAAQLVLGLVEPQSSGLGGGAFALYYDAQDKSLHAYDARETAPYLVSPYLFQGLRFQEARKGGRAVGVPAMPMLLEDLHQSHGHLTWMELFEDAQKLAEEGFEISPRLRKMIEAHRDHLPPLYTQAGQVLKNSDYARTLRDFAFSGAAPFYKGRIASDIINAVQNNPHSAGLLTARDLQDYRVKKRKSLCAPYRAYKICSMNEPSSGGLTLLQILGLIEPLAEKPALPMVLEASRLAFADRARYMGDPDFTQTAGEALLDPSYLAQRRKLISVDAPMTDIKAGDIPMMTPGGLDDSIDRPGTTHLIAMDKEGSVISMTASIESAFGSYVMVDGFLLNNQLTDFAFDPYDANGMLKANSVAGGKRPRSSMAPVIAFDAAGDPVLALGSAGGSRIIGYVLQSLLAMVDHDQSVTEAIASPHILARTKGAEVERGASPRNLQILRDYGYAPTMEDMNSGLTALRVKAGVISAAADPRREGLAMGE